jgi:hypothetical protein
VNIPDSAAGAARRLSAILLLLAGLAVPLRAEAARPQPPLARVPALLPAPPAPRADDGTKEGHAALSAASSAKRTAQKLEGEERDGALAAVAAKYAGIAGTESFTASERAEAAFRGGEVLRTLDKAAEADAQFARATELGEETESGREFAGRGLLERAHMKRRANDADGALALYAEVSRRFGDQRRTAAHARTWSGKLLLKAGRLDDAAKQLLGFAEAYPEYAAEAVRNADLLAVAQVEAGDESAARATVERLRRELEPVMAKGDKVTDDAQAALDNLRVTELLGGY